MNSEYVSSSLMKLFLSKLISPWLNTKGKKGLRRKKSWNLLGHHQEPVIFSQGLPQEDSGTHGSAILARAYFAYDARDRP